MIVLYGTINTRVALHEIGHNFGLAHASFIAYDGTGLIDLSRCPIQGNNPCEYGDPWDVMGSSDDGFHAFNQLKLGWLTDDRSSAMEPTNPDREVDLTTLDEGIRDLKIPLTNTDGYSYHLEYYNDPTHQPAGVAIRLDQPFLIEAGGGKTSYLSFLLAGANSNASLGGLLTHVGQSYVDAPHGISVVLESLETDTAKVHVTIPPVPPPHIDSINFNLTKKLIVHGEGFGTNAYLIINGVDLSDSVIWQTRTNTTLKTKAKYTVYGFKTGQNNSIQVKVITGALSITSDPFLIRF